ncbi:unnamed protein product [Triticum turgidum subsp. durum]|uniref:APO domain-containing protein n=1 Tax=Triticum turgidum subsp. durum TaxID=4567 RepID=A0A9R0YSR7_TRITD|nr:unnamed protein product [Triticum turgidum subsp. durum]
MVLKFYYAVPLAQVRGQLDAFAGIGSGARGCGARFRAPASSASQPCYSSTVIRNDNSQNADFPRNYSKREKKPFPIPVLELRRRARQRMKEAEGKPRGPPPPPKNGLLVQRLIPEAYRVYNARILLINNLKRLIKVVPVKGCKYCSEIHVGSVGHPFRTCRGMSSDKRKGEHDWGSTFVEAVFLPVEAYHLEDRLGPRIPHDQRFEVPRVPALVELCIQAGLDLPEYPTKRRRKPIVKIGRKEFVDANEDDLPDPEPDKFKEPILEEISDDEITPPSSPEETAALAEETLEVWETLRNGALRLMKRYSVRVCGYCPEVHIGASGHKARNCGAFKHQQRNGQHGWQAAVLDDLIPPRYVWHMPESGELQKELKIFYGQAPAVVEICIQGGAQVPEKYKATMRLDIGIPSSLKEAEMVV